MKKLCRLSSFLLAMLSLVILGAGAGPACGGSDEPSPEITEMASISQAEFCWAGVEHGAEGAPTWYSVHCDGMGAVSTPRIFSLSSQEYLDNALLMIESMDNAGYAMVGEFEPSREGAGIYLFRLAEKQTQDPAQFAILAELLNHGYAFSDFLFSEASGDSTQLNIPNRQTIEAWIDAKGYTFVKELLGNTDNIMAYSLYRK